MTAILVWTLLTIVCHGTIIYLDGGWALCKEDSLVDKLARFTVTCVFSTALFFIWLGLTRALG